MIIKEAMLTYFEKLEALYRKQFGTLPTVSWSAELSQDLFLGTPDDDYEIQWKAKPADSIHLPGLCDDLTEFFSSFYYWELRGTYDGILFVFPAVITHNNAVDVARAALTDGNYYFPKQDTALLATCSVNNFDETLLFYRQKTGELFLYDLDLEKTTPLDYTLVTLISSMKAVI